MPLPRALAPDLFVVDHPFRAPGGLELGARSTLVRGADGSLVMISPGPLGPALRDWLGVHGPVGALVAPSLLHHLSLRENSAAFPRARLYGPAGLAEKTGIGVETLAGSPTPWPGVLDALALAGCPKMNELVFLHRPSGTLILTDLAFHYADPRALGFGTRLFLRANGVLGRFGPSRLARWVYFEDRAALAGSLERLLDWPFERIVVAHGAVVERDARACFRRAFATLLA